MRVLPHLEWARAVREGSLDSPYPPPDRWLTPRPHVSRSPPGPRSDFAHGSTTGRGELHTRAPVPGRAVQQPLSLRPIHRKEGRTPAQLRRRPLRAVPAQRIRRRRQRLGRILVSLRPVRASGDRDQGGQLALVVGVRLPPGSRPFRRPAVPRLSGGGEPCGRCPAPLPGLPPARRSRTTTSLR